MSAILDTTAAILAEVDRALAIPEGVCLVCGCASEREWCCNWHRLQLFLMRRGESQDGLWSECTPWGERGGW